MGADMDLSEINTLAFDIERAAGRTLGKVVAVVSKGALNVKTEAAQFASGLAHAPRYPASITYDLDAGWLSGQVSAQIGPDKGRPQGALGNILEYGTSKNAPLPHLGPALDREGPRMESALADVAEDLWP